jgi:two-component system OmpR family sensor kinase
MTDSLRVRLSLWLGSTIAGVALLAAAFALYSARQEALELQDDLLRQIASFYDAGHLPPPRGAAAPARRGSDESARIEVGLLPPAGDVGTGWLPGDLADGLHTLAIADEPYRVFVRHVAPERGIAIAQQAAVRDEIALDSAMLVLVPFVLLVPALLLLVNLILRSSFRPVERLAAQVEQRGDQELHPLDPQPVPVEFRSFVVAINRLLDRVGQSMQAQRRFVADAAHELRSPLTALSLQAERLDDEALPPAARERVAALRLGVERSRVLIEQLLSLARAQASETAGTGAVSLDRVLRQVIEGLMPLADARRQQIEVLGEPRCLLRGSAIEIETLLRNLLDNALRYSPAQGRVRISVESGDGRVRIVVEDEGPGIAEAERVRVFDPFYRVPGSGTAGSGLGLAIVRTLVERLGGELEFDARPGNASGLRAVLCLPSGEGLPHGG